MQQSNIHEQLEKFIKQKERFYRRPLSNQIKFLLKEFANTINIEPVVQDQPIIQRKIKKSVVTPRVKKDVKIGKRIAFITEDVGHLTGGRYYAYFIASALVELGHQVTLYTNKRPVFHGSFKNYKLP